MNRGIECNPKHCKELSLFGSEEKYVLVIQRLTTVSDDSKIFQTDQSNQDRFSSKDIPGYPLPVSLRPKGELSNCAKRMENFKSLMTVQCVKIKTYLTVFPSCSYNKLLWFLEFYYTRGFVHDFITHLFVQPLSFFYSTMK